MSGACGPVGRRHRAEGPQRRSDPRAACQAIRLSGGLLRSKPPSSLAAKRGSDDGGGSANRGHCGSVAKGRPVLGVSRTGHPGRGQAADKASRTARRCRDLFGRRSSFHPAACNAGNSTRALPVFPQAEHRRRLWRRPIEAALSTHADPHPHNSNGGQHLHRQQPEKGTLVRVGPIPTGRTDVACNQALSG